MLARIDDNVLDAGARSAGAERFCALAREVRPASELIRFVVGPDGSVVPDLKRNLPGRGLWITGTKDAVSEATRRKLFAKGFKREVRVAGDLADATGRLLERAVLDALAIVAKAGHVVAGFSKVDAAIARERLAALLHASDGAPDGIRKLDAALRRRIEEAGGDDGTIITVGEFTTAQLDLALGRSNVVHAALLAGPASEGFLSRYSRMMRFRTGDANKPGHGGARHRKPEGLDSE